MAGTANFVEAQAANRRSTMLLLGLLTALAAGFGYLIGWAFQTETTDTFQAVSPAGLAIGGLGGPSRIGEVDALSDRVAHVRIGKASVARHLGAPLRGAVAQRERRRFVHVVDREAEVIESLGLDDAARVGAGVR